MTFDRLRQRRSRRRGNGFVSAIALGRGAESGGGGPPGRARRLRRFSYGSRRIGVGPTPPGPVSTPWSPGCGPVWGVLFSASALSAVKAVGGLRTSWEDAHCPDSKPWCAGRASVLTPCRIVRAGGHHRVPAHRSSTSGQKQRSAVSRRTAAAAGRRAHGRWRTCEKVNRRRPREYEVMAGAACGCAACLLTARVFPRATPAVARRVVIGSCRY